MPRRLRNTTSALRHGWHPVARSAEVRDEPVAVRLLGQPWVLARLDGTLAAFADRCPHRLAPLSAGRVDGQEIVCAYHGWRFVVSGECTAVPALGAGVPTPRRARAVAAWGVTERHGLVWIAPAEPVADLIELPEADQAGFDSVWLTPVRSSAPAALLADNFLDTAHFPFVHAATIGAGEDTVVPPYRVTPDGAGFTVRMEQEVANPEDPLVGSGEHPLIQRRWSTYGYQPPFMLRLRLEYPDAATTNTILFCLQPEDERSTRIYTRLLRDDLGGDETRIAQAARFEQAVLDEDLALQERFDLDGLPLGGDGSQPGEEVSIRADAAGVALRRALAALVDTVGGADGADRADRADTRASDAAGRPPGEHPGGRSEPEFRRPLSRDQRPG
ncbi:aromatic ring-hydroxylating dioxygenase subunit alpha [Frankia sp. AgB32]|uniref:aromatic ring-hydroxylating oxygenase subunit alpha n=1 Tax=Frankia sp. AgB32 TaxID=631119 RepID=UPI00200EBB8E|nr:aromatic ring-hydroxylating dioxygenase subunit alpha [Frankia sp. AgB32]MCK9893385.1 aromatic ring-hydroxylating dioxygenase subunit alpha [Frankia sp. AgB32]